MIPTVLLATVWNIDIKWILWRETCISTTMVKLPDRNDIMYQTLMYFAWMQPQNDWHLMSKKSKGKRSILL